MIQELINDLHYLNSMGETPDGDGITVNVQLWAERWVARLESDATLINAKRWNAMRQTLVAADFAPEMGGGPVVMFACHAERVGFDPDGADAIADAAVTAMNGANT